MKRHVSVLVLLALVGGAALAAQAAKPTPRTPDGRPDLSGMWYRRVAGPVTQRVGSSIVRVAGNPTVPDRYNPGAPKYKPEFLARVKEMTDDQINVDPSFHCGPPGIIRIGPPQRIVQTPREVVILYDDLNGSFFRVIPIDGRKHRTGIEPSSLGDAVGRWQGDTLVIDVRNISDTTWLGDNGLFHTENTRVTERLTRKGDTLIWEAVVEDPEVFVEPWTVTPRTLTLVANAEIEEAAFCEDRGVADRVTKDYHGNVR
jgi:hypothetical protein